MALPARVDKDDKKCAEPESESPSLPSLYRKNWNPLEAQVLSDKK